MNDFVFRDTAEGLEFIGDFEGLYRSVENPWLQTGNDGPIGVYYNYSRARLVEIIRRYHHKSAAWGLEIGCGHGHVVNILSKLGNMTWEGMDISPSAIGWAATQYPKLGFYIGDVMDRADLPARKYEVVVLGQMLWYILHDLRTAIDNCLHLTKVGGMFVVSQAFLTNQRYGKETIDGFAGALKFFVNEYSDQLELIEARYDDSGRLSHNDGLMVFRRRRYAVDGINQNQPAAEEPVC